MTAFLLGLFCRAEIRGIAAALRSCPNHWYNHVGLIPGVTHVVHAQLKFSICICNGHTTMLNKHGQVAFPLSYAEKKLIRYSLLKNLKSFVTVEEPRAALSQVNAAEKVERSTVALSD